MSKSVWIAAASAFVIALGAAGCNRNADTESKASGDTARQAPPAGSIGGPGSTSGGLTGDPAAGTSGGAATADKPQGMGGGSGTFKTDRSGMASRPTEDSQVGTEPRPDAQRK